VQGCLTIFHRFSRFTLALTYRQNLKIQRVLVGPALKLRDLFFSASPNYSSVNAELARRVWLDDAATQ
jgi:hypothetical protein